MTKDNVERYGYYRKYARKLADFPMTAKPTAADIGLTMAAKQTAYREMRSFEFPGSVVDYVAYATAMYFLELWVTSIGNLGHWPPTTDEWQNQLLLMLRQHPVEGRVAIRAARLITIYDIHALSCLDEYEKNQIVTAAVFNLGELRHQVKTVEAKGEQYRRFTKELGEMGLGWLIGKSKENQGHTSDIAASSKTNTPQPTIKLSANKTTFHFQDGDTIELHHLGHLVESSKQEKKAAQRSGAAPRRSPNRRPQ